jgi:CAAX prenyl protease-like protein
MPRYEGHGWWPYLLPMVSFLLLVELGGRVPESVAPIFFALKVAVPLGLFLYYARGGSYPELRGFRPTAGGLALDVLVGLAGAAIWMAPFVLVDSIRPGSEDAFDPHQFGASLVAVTLTVRAIGYSLVTPFVEELFVRSWLLRYLDVFDRNEDFRDVPIARFRWRSFIGVLIYFVLSHVMWEWSVMFLWSLGTMLWFYHRKHIVPLVIVHAVTNFSIFAFAVLANDRFLDGAGNPISLWFFI